MPDSNLVAFVEHSLVNRENIDEVQWRLIQITNLESAVERCE